MQQEPTNDTASAGAVYVQTNAAPNELIAFRRADDGSLDLIGSVATGGEGDGTPHLQSQESVTLTSDGQYLLVTNAASDDLSVFSVAAVGSIELRERVHTGAGPGVVPGARRGHRTGGRRRSGARCERRRSRASRVQPRRVDGRDHPARHRLDRGIRGNSRRHLRGIQRGRL